MPKFGTSGLRGLADDLTDDLVAAYATAFLERDRGNGSVLIGRDLRASSARIATAVAAGAARVGVKTLDCGLLPTPALALEAARLGTHAIMVTGSHIPADRNGLKFYVSGDEITKADEAWLTSGAEAWAAKPLGMTSEISPHPDAGTKYCQRYVDFFGADALAGLTVGVFEHSSVARDTMIALIEALGGWPVPLGRSETFVPVDTDAVGGDMRRQLKDWALHHHLDAIVSTDGDADRPMVTDQTGTVLLGDRLGPLTAAALGAEVIATPVSSNGLVDLMGQFDVHRTRIGSPFVIEAMERAMTQGAKVVGYEPNGGFLLGFAAQRDGRTLSPLMTRDFALPMLTLLAEARTRHKSLSDLSAELPRRFTATDRLTEIPVAVSRALVERILAGDREFLPDEADKVVSVDTTDGVRLYLADGAVLHVRPSGNAPELRCYVEADDQRAADGLLSETLAGLRAEAS